jgi:hypothetical protein
LHNSKDTWRLYGPVAGYFTYQPYLDDSGLPVPDPDKQVTFLGQWVWNDVNLGGELTAPGKFDTQTALFQRLGYPDTALSGAGISFVRPILDSEEELISARFAIIPQAIPLKSALRFQFYVGIDSRRITLKALHYGFSLRALQIDGIDPVSNSAAIYSGAYPFSRKIHVISAQAATANAQAFVRFLLSANGQRDVAKLYYLPLQPAGAVN